MPNLEPKLPGESTAVIAVALPGNCGSILAAGSSGIDAVAAPLPRTMVGIGLFAFLSSMNCRVGACT